VTDGASPGANSEADVAAGANGATSALIEAREMSTGYGPIEVLTNVSLTVRLGEVVALLGPNGAGKSTCLLALAGELPLSAGCVVWQGRTEPVPLYRKAREGLRLITEDKAIFMGLTVADNIRLAHRTPDGCLELFPELGPLLRRRVGQLSGGEQQMLTLARALTGSTKLLLADELSLGLAPLVVERLLRAVRAAADRGLGVLLVEQQFRKALRVADRAYVLSRGQVVVEGTAAELHTRSAELEANYLSGV
jgi:branched-chain amino acid transport system ATP-binding protein